MKIIKVLLLLVFLYFITSSFIDWLVEDSKEIKELIRQGYLPSDWTHEDIFKLCNPETDEEREAAKGADLFQSCINNGAW